MRIGEHKNEHGVPVAEYVCKTCGTNFTVCPAPNMDEGWENCMGPECDSYDPARDMDYLFQDDPKVIPIRKFKFWKKS